MDEDKNITSELNISNFLSPYVASSISVTVVGIMTNLLSLSYFVTQRKSNDRLSATEALNKKLFITLNILDILVCISLSTLLLNLFVNGFDAMNRHGKIFLSIFLITNQCTGFITCLLSMIRAISIIWPQRYLNFKIINTASLCFGVVMIILHKKSAIDDGDEVSRIGIFFAVILMFIIVIFSNILCITKLMSSQLAPWKRNATITMGILSLLYCTLNIGYLVIHGFYVFEYCPSDKGKFCKDRAFEIMSVYVLLPLNSAGNPIIYFIRNAKMRKYLTKLRRRIAGMCRNTEQEEVQGKNATVSIETRGETDVARDFVLSRTSDRTVAVSSDHTRVVK